MHPLNFTSASLDPAAAVTLNTFSSELYSSLGGQSYIIIKEEEWTEQKKIKGRDHVSDYWKDSKCSYWGQSVGDLWSWIARCTHGANWVVSCYLASPHFCWIILKLVQICSSGSGRPELREEPLSHQREVLCSYSITADSSALFHFNTLALWLGIK